MPLSSPPDTSPEPPAQLVAGVSPFSSMPLPAGAVAMHSDKDGQVKAEATADQRMEDVAQETSVPSPSSLPQPAPHEPKAETVLCANVAPVASLPNQEATGMEGVETAKEGMQQTHTACALSSAVIDMTVSAAASEMSMKQEAVASVASAPAAPVAHVHCHGEEEDEDSDDEDGDTKAAGGSAMTDVAGATSSGRQKISRVSCHQCKTTKDDAVLLFCTTKAEKGKRKRKCRKKYCDACLRRSYNMSLSSLSPSEIASYQCPACTGTCSCAACQRKQLESIVRKDTPGGRPGAGGPVGPTPPYIGSRSGLVFPGPFSPLFGMNSFLASMAASGSEVPASTLAAMQQMAALHGIPPAAAYTMAAAAHAAGVPFLPAGPAAAAASSGTESNSASAAADSSTSADGPSSTAPASTSSNASALAAEHMKMFMAQLAAQGMYGPAAQAHAQAQQAQAQQQTQPQAHDQNPASAQSSAPAAAPAGTSASGESSSGAAVPSPQASVSTAASSPPAAAALLLPSTPAGLHTPNPSATPVANSLASPSSQPASSPASCAAISAVSNSLAQLATSTPQEVSPQPPAVPSSNESPLNGNNSGSGASAKQEQQQLRPSAAPILPPISAAHMEGVTVQPSPSLMSEASQHASQSSVASFPSTSPPAVAPVAPAGMSLAQQQAAAAAAAASTQAEIEEKTRQLKELLSRRLAQDPNFLSTLDSSNREALGLLRGLLGLPNISVATKQEEERPTATTAVPSDVSGWTEQGDITDSDAARERSRVQQAAAMQAKLRRYERQLAQEASEHDSIHAALSKLHASKTRSLSASRRAASTGLPEATPAVVVEGLAPPPKARRASVGSKPRVRAPRNPVGSTSTGASPARTYKRRGTPPSPYQRLQAADAAAQRAGRMSPSPPLFELPAPGAHSAPSSVRSSPAMRGRRASVTKERVLLDGAHSAMMDDEIIEHSLPQAHHASHGSPHHAQRAYVQTHPAHTHPQPHPGPPHAVMTSKGLLTPSDPNYHRWVAKQQAAAAAAAQAQQSQQMQSAHHSRGSSHSSQEALQHASYQARVMAAHKLLLEQRQHARHPSGSHGSGFTSSATGSASSYGGSGFRQGSYPMVSTLNLSSVPEPPFPSPGAGGGPLFSPPPPAHHSSHGPLFSPTALHGGGLFSPLPGSTSPPASSAAAGLFSPPPPVLEGSATSPTSAALQMAFGLAPMSSPVPGQHAGADFPMASPSAGPGTGVQFGLAPSSSPGVGGGAASSSFLFTPMPMAGQGEREGSATYGHTPFDWSHAQAAMQQSAAAGGASKGNSPGGGVSLGLPSHSPTASVGPSSSSFSALSPHVSIHGSTILGMLSPGGALADESKYAAMQHHAASASAGLMSPSPDGLPMLPTPSG